MSKSCPDCGHPTATDNVGYGPSPDITLRQQVRCGCCQRQLGVHAHFWREQPADQIWCCQCYRRALDGTSFHCVTVASVFINNDKGQTLLGLRTKETSPYWCNFGGKLERHEDAATAAFRETREELGIDITSGQQIGHVMVRTESELPRMLLIFRANQWRGEPHNMEPDKCQEIGWFDFDNLPEPLMPSIKLMREQPDLWPIISRR